MRDRFLSKISVNCNGCHLWTANTAKNGYGRFKLRDGTQAPAHRIAWEIANGPIPYGLQVLHKCDVRSCVNPEHLFLGTHGDNMRDMVNKRRGLLGEMNGRAKLTSADVIAIRGSSKSHAELGRVFGVSPETIRHARIGLKWKFLEHGALLSIHPYLRGDI
jgi:HNH endonuclease